MTAISSRELNQNITDSLAMPGVEDIEFEPQRMAVGTNPADLLLDTNVVSEATLINPWERR